MKPLFEITPIPNVPQSGSGEFQFKLDELMAEAAKICAFPMREKPRPWTSAEIAMMRQREASAACYLFLHLMLWEQEKSG